MEQEAELPWGKEPAYCPFSEPNHPDDALPADF